MSGITIANLTFTILNFLILVTLIIAGIIAKNEIQKMMHPSNPMFGKYQAENPPTGG
jgi:hypothetical protein